MNKQKKKHKNNKKKRVKNVARKKTIAKKAPIKKDKKEQKIKKEKKNIKEKNAYSNIIYYRIFLSICLILILILIFMVINPKSSCIEEKEETYVFLGDSITHRYDLETYYSNLSAINSGVEGNRTVDILNDMKNRVFQYHPDRVILLIGINQIELDEEKQIVNDIKEIIEEIEEYDKNVVIYIQSIYPINAEMKDGAATSKNNDKIKRVNDLLKEYCKKNKAIYINVYDELLDEKGNLNEKYTYDGLHINNDGYKIITDIIEQNLYVYEKEG